MITSALLYLVYAFILAITSPLRLLDDVVVNASVSSSVTTASGYISGLNSFLPVSTILTIFGVLIAYEVILVGYKIIKWVYQKIPMIN